MKGWEFSIVGIVSMIIIIGLLFYLWFFIQGNYWIVTTDFEKMKNLRMAANIANLVSGSSELLAYSDGNNFYAKVLDPSKLDNIEQRLSSVYYPGYSHRITVTELETGKKWQLTKGPVFKRIEEGASYQIVGVLLPVNIFYSMSDVKMGVVRVELSKE
jgi:hypothetical protein